MTKTKQQLEIERLRHELEIARNQQEREAHFHNAATDRLARRLADVTEDRRRLTLAVESLSRRCDMAEGYVNAKAPVSAIER